MSKAYLKFIFWLGVSILATVIGTAFMECIDKTLIVNNILSFFIIYLITIFVFIFSKGVFKKIVLFIFCFLTGCDISTIIIYCNIDNRTIVLSLLLVLILFVICSSIGYFIKKDISKWGLFLFVALITIFVLTLFVYSLFVCVLIVILYSIFIIYDTWMFKVSVENNENLTDDDILDFVMNSYLDLVNIFVAILRIFSNN